MNNHELFLIIVVAITLMIPAGITGNVAKQPSDSELTQEEKGFISAFFSALAEIAKGNEAKYEAIPDDALDEESVEDAVEESVEETDACCNDDELKLLKANIENLRAEVRQPDPLLAPLRNLRDGKCEFAFPQVGQTCKTACEVKSKICITGIMRSDKYEDGVFIDESTSKTYLWGCTMARSEEKNGYRTTLDCQCC